MLINLYSSQPYYVPEDMEQQHNSLMFPYCIILWCNFFDLNIYGQHGHNNDVNDAFPYIYYFRLIYVGLIYGYCYTVTDKSKCYLLTKYEVRRHSICSVNGASQEVHQKEDHPLIEGPSLIRRRALCLIISWTKIMTWYMTALASSFMLCWRVHKMA